jgi:hypothetical protein
LIDGKSQNPNYKLQINSNGSNSKKQTRIDLQKLETYRLTLKKFDITLRLNSESQSPLKGRRFIPARKGLNVDLFAQFSNQYLSTHLSPYKSNIEDLVTQYGRG